MKWEPWKGERKERQLAWEWGAVSGVEGPQHRKSMTFLRHRRLRRTALLKAVVQMPRERATTSELE